MEQLQLLQKQGLLGGSVHTDMSLCHDLLHVDSMRLKRNVSSWSQAVCGPTHTTAEGVLPQQGYLLLSYRSLVHTRLLTQNV